MRALLVLIALALSVLLVRACKSEVAAKDSDPDAVVKYQLRLAKEADERAAAEAAQIEAAKSPQQRASEAAAKKIAEAQERAAIEKTRAAEEKREAVVAKLDAGLAKLEWWDLCARWGREHRKGRDSPATEAIYRRLKQRSMINMLDEQVVGVRQKMPEVGMTGCGTMAVLGVSEDSNVSTNAYATRVQMVYRSRGLYVYTEGRPGDHNGVVASIQY